MDSPNGIDIRGTMMGSIGGNITPSRYMRCEWYAKTIGNGRRLMIRTDEKELLRFGGGRGWRAHSGAAGGAGGGHVQRQ